VYGATRVPLFSAQSPSERWDGDHALSYGPPLPPSNLFVERYQEILRTVAATEG